MKHADMDCLKEWKDSLKRRNTITIYTYTNNVVNDKRAKK